MFLISLFGSFGSSNYPIYSKEIFRPSVNKFSLKQLRTGRRSVTVQRGKLRVIISLKPKWGFLDWLKSGIKIASSSPY